MIHHTGRGLVLRRNYHHEEDMRLTLFLREIGRVIVLAKGGSKFSNRLKSLQEPLTEADYHVALAPHGVHARLIGGKLISSAHQLTKNWDLFSLASKCCEVVDLLLPFRAPSPDVYDILHLTLQRLSTSSLPMRQWIHFNVRMLSTLGYGDVTKDVLRLFQPDESKRFNDSLLMDEGDHAWSSVSEASLNRCQSFLEIRLGALLPRPLKSGALVES